MVHLLVINYVGLLPLGSLMNHVITLFGSILLSAFIYFMYEEPLRKRIRFGAKKKEKLQQESVPAVVMKDPMNKIKENISIKLKSDLFTETFLLLLGQNNSCSL
jgi:hypothetical protein